MCHLWPKYVCICERRRKKIYISSKFAVDWFKNIYCNHFEYKQDDTTKKLINWIERKKKQNKRTDLQKK